MPTETLVHLARQHLALAHAHLAAARLDPQDYLADFLARTHAHNAKRYADLATTPPCPPVPVIHSSQ